MAFRFISPSTVAVLVLLAACKGPEVGPPLSQESNGASGSGSGGSGGNSNGTDPEGDGGADSGRDGGSSGTGGTLEGDGGSGSTGGADPGGNGGSGGGMELCADGAIRGTCPEPQFCSDGVWVPAELRCEACGIVDCPASVPDCCTGFGVFALTAGTFLPKPQAITEFAVEPDQVVAEFTFQEAYEVGGIYLTLPDYLPIRSLVIEYSMEGNVYPDFSLERAPDVAGGVYWDGPTFDGIVDLTDPVTCFPSWPCPTSYNQLSVRLRPTAPGVARLTVTSIAFELE